MSAKAAGSSELARLGLAPRGLSREQAAAYIGVSPGLFDRMVDDGRMPRAKKANGRRLWDRLALDAAFAALPSDDAEEDTGEGGGLDSGDKMWRVSP